MNNYSNFEKAVEITKEYVRGGGSIKPDTILEDLYKKLKELSIDASQE